MRATRYFLPTLRETPAEAESVSHRLMLRAGLMRRTAMGIYSWLPAGLKVLRKVEQVVREEMDRSGAQEILMPMVQPGELWRQSGRWDAYGAELLRLEDRHNNAFCLGPTHEEVVTELVRRELSSYRQLPLTLYQIQNKFRDEIRPRYGVMRAREFLMKDAYSFHIDHECLARTYEEMRLAYRRIFDRLELEYLMVEADSGNIGGKVSHEFHALAECGEDILAFSADGSYAANLELVPCPPVGDPQPAPPREKREEIPTPGLHGIEELAAALKVAPQQTLKTLLVKGADGGLVALVLRGDHQLNPRKACSLEAVANPLQMATEAECRRVMGAPAGCYGPLGMTLPIIADHAARQTSDFVCGANREGFHYRGVNWERDLPAATAADLRNAVTGDTAPGSGTPLQLKHGIEMGHLFQLGDKYSQLLQAAVQDAKGAMQTPLMGCYGIGISRIVAAAIEQRSPTTEAGEEAQGIRWPTALAPFQAAVVPLRYHDTPEIRRHADALYDALRARGIDTLLDDRNERPGVKFADLELLGIPHCLVLGPRSLAKGEVEYRRAGAAGSRQVPLEGVLSGDVALFASGD